MDTLTTKGCGKGSHLRPKRTRRTRMRRTLPPEAPDLWTAACLTHNGPFSPPSPGMSDDIGKYIVIGFVLLFGALAWRAWQIRQHSPEWAFVMG